MRTTLDIDDDLMRAAILAHPDESKTAIVERALRRYLEERSIAMIRDLVGKVEFDEAYLNDMRAYELEKRERRLNDAS